MFLMCATVPSHGQGCILWGNEPPPGGNVECYLGKNEKKKQEKYEHCDRKKGREGVKGSIFTHVLEMYPYLSMPVSLSMSISLFMFMN
jgi:hypothetical protein